MKKLLSLLLVLVMVVSLFAACQPAENPTDPTTDNGPTLPPATDPPAPTDPPKVDAEPLPENALYHWDFETLDGLKAVEQTKDGTTVTGIVDSEHAILTADGVKGKSLYLDGKYGVKLDLTGMDIADDSYTISFWIYAERLGDFMPIVQLGRNINSADTTLPTTWLNFTRGSCADTYPLAWNRNTSIPWATDENGVFPWIAGPADVVYGKGEWCLVTLVVDGNRYTCLDDNGERIGTRYYLNGELVFDASAEFLYYQGVAPELFTGSPVDGFIGINYWDSVYKGYVDELVIYDEALTSGQVVSLFEQGDPTVVPSAPVEGGGVEEEPVIVLPEITVNPDAIATLGTTERNLGWWTQWTDSTELADGKTMTIKLKNYSAAGNNWSNFAGILANVATTGDKAPADHAGYAEYCVFRADNWSWAGAAGGTFVGVANNAGQMTMSWTDWAAWLEVMKAADVEIKLTRADGVISVAMTFTGADGTVMTESGNLMTDIAADAPVHVLLTAENAYVEVLSITVE